VITAISQAESPLEAAKALRSSVIFKGEVK